MKINNLVKQAQQMQQRMMELQEELANQTVEATIGGGMVTAVVNGQQELISLNISPDVVDPEDVEMLEDLIVAAVNEARQRAHDLMAQEMDKLTGGVKLPGLP
jgi:DNA-binding YbaB/EbfC family protein